jgi:broad specificity phosphatase PhoE
LNLSLVSRESLLRANVQPEKKLRDVNFKDRRGLYAPSTLKSPPHHAEAAGEEWESSWQRGCRRRRSVVGAIEEEFFARRIPPVKFCKQLFGSSIGE